MAGAVVVPVARQPVLQAKVGGGCSVLHDPLYNHPLQWTGQGVVLHRPVGFSALTRPLNGVALSGGRIVRLYTQPECEDWLARRSRVKPDLTSDVHSVRVAYPPEPHRIRFLSRWIATELSHQSSVLLWITEWGIWPSSENWHLYYKLRQSYSDYRLLDEAPGHLFLGHEAEDLASFLQVAVLNGWGGYVLTELDYVNVFFSHDEYLDFFAGAEQNLADVRKVWTPGQPAAG